MKNTAFFLALGLSLGACTSNPSDDSLSPQEEVGTEIDLTEDIMSQDMVDSNSMITEEAPLSPDEHIPPPLIDIEDLEEMERMREILKDEEEWVEEEVIWFDDGSEEEEEELGDG
ncbi:MAG: hypothetical protein QNK23_02740 [Crocinitomicaceae bacterium]|nr:hypothetical protein [Crocinitomicaceae bacterium]